ncbi:MAG: hypothetical protein J6K48_01300 [Lachnospiraceae bacterium]|nr:hypothetical protein [Lachnospiraceae bacterium]
MSNYELNIDFKESDLSMIYAAGEKVVVVKHTAGDQDKQVAWLTFKPFAHNTIQWQENYAVYASDTELQGGAAINKLSDKEAATKVVYGFDKGYFGTATPCNDLEENSYGIKNDMAGYPLLTFGLAQDVTVNGRAFANNPINAISIPYGQSANMTPIEKVDVYLRKDVDDGTVISHIMSVALPVTYGEGENVHSIEYDGSIGKFYPVK